MSVVLSVRSVSKVGCIVLWMLVDTHGVAKLSLYWARLALAPRTGHTGVACRNMNVIVVLFVTVPLVLVLMLLVLVSDVSVLLEPLVLVVVLLVAVVVVTVVLITLVFVMLLRVHAIIVAVMPGCLWSPLWFCSLWGRSSWC